MWAGTAFAAPDLPLHYTASLGPLTLFRADATLQQDSRGYRLHCFIRSSGVSALLSRGQTDLVTEGVFTDAGSRATRLQTAGVWNGKPRRLVVDFTATPPRVVERVPALPPQRKPPPDLAGSIDLLGMVVGLLHAEQATGHCTAQARVFDGHGIVAVAVEDAAPAAPGLVRCDFTTRKVDGTGRVGRGFALLGPAGAGLALVPVRLVFRHFPADMVLRLVAPQSAK